MDPAMAVVARMHHVLDEAAGLPLGCLTAGAAAHWLVQLQSIQNRMAALVCASFPAAGSAAAVAQETGHRSTADLVAARTGANPRTVRGDLRLGVWLLDYPILAAAFEQGRVSKEHVRAIRARENPRTRPHMAEAQDYLVEAAWSCQWAEFMAVLRYWELAADPDGDEPNDQIEARSLNYDKRGDGTVTGRFTLDPLAGHGVLTAIESQVQRLFRQDAESGSLRSAAQRRADAFVDLIMGPGPSEPLIHVVVSEAVVADHFDRLADPAKRLEPLPVDYDDEIDGRCELIDGEPIHPSHAVAAMATAAFRRLVFDPDSEITDLGREARCFPPVLKQALLVKARGRSQHPGCDAPVSWMQADHLMPWSRDGPTSLGNGQILCDPHNKWKRDGPPLE